MRGKRETSRKRRRGKRNCECERKIEINKKSKERIEERTPTCENEVRDNERIKKEKKRK